MDIFHGLANRAESLLEKIDGQAARTVEDFTESPADREWKKEAKKVTDRLQNATRYVSRSATPVSERSTGSRNKDFDSEYTDEDAGGDDDVSWGGASSADGGEDTTNTTTLSTADHVVAATDEEVMSITSKKKKKKKKKKSPSPDVSPVPEVKSTQSRRVEALEKELDVLDGQLVRMQQDLDAAQDALVKSQKLGATRQRKFKQEYAELQSSSKEREEQLLERLKEIEHKCTELESENEELVSANEHFDEDYTELQSENDRLTEELQKAKKQLRESSQSRHVEDLENELQANENNTEQMRRQFTAQLHEAEKRVAELEFLNSELSTEVASQQRKLDEKDDIDFQAQEATYSEDHQSDVYEAQERQRQAEELLAQERKKLYIAQQELESLKSELDRTTQKMEQIEKRRQDERNQSHQQVSALKLELENIKRKDDIQGIAALEQRLAALSEHLVAKQKQIELLTSEKGALRQRLKNLQKEQQMQTSRPISMQPYAYPSSGDVEAGGNQVSLRYRRRQEAAARRIARLGPIAQYEGLASAIDAVDQFSLTTGAMLYQQPWARLGFLFYFFLIHIWVMYVVTFHAPEPPSSRNMAPPGVVQQQL